MTSPDSLERPIDIGSVALSGTSRPTFGPEVMTRRVAAFAADPAGRGAWWIGAGTGASAAGILRTRTPNRSARSE
jgi:hypothetical protein